MITTSTTSILPINEKLEADQNFPVNDTPSKETLDFILNYSKNLQISKSRFVKEIELIKS